MSLESQVVMAPAGSGRNVVVVMMAYWYMWWPHGSGWPLAIGGDPLVVAVNSWWGC